MKTNKNSNLDPKGDMSILEHLEEIRRRLIHSCLVVIIFSCVGFYYAEHIFRFLSRPLIQVLPEFQNRMVFTGLPEVFFVYMKVGLFAGLILSAPFLFFQIWKFISVGLYPHEKTKVLPFVLFSTTFFLLGASFCYYQVFPWGFKFFISFSSDSIMPMITLREYLKFVIRLILVFGIIFEMPIVTAFLSGIGLLTPGALRKYRAYVIVGIFIVAALLTPPDVITQLALAIPMLLLYEISIWTAVIFRRR